jgi:hypothetical protein
METAGTVVNDALSEVMSETMEHPREADDLWLGIRHLNRMMASWEARGLKLNFTKIENPDDELTVPAGAIKAIIENLAISLCSSFGVGVSPSLAASAGESMKAVYAICADIKPAQIPKDLPLGIAVEGHQPYNIGPQIGDQNGESDE